MKNLKKMIFDKEYFLKNVLVDSDYDWKVSDIDDCLEGNSF